MDNAIKLNKKDFYQSEAWTVHRCLYFKACNIVQHKGWEQKQQLAISLSVSMATKSQLAAALKLTN